MDEPSDEWEIQEYSSSACCSSKASWFFEKGLWLGKRVALTGFVISSAPLVLPPLVVATAVGVAVSIPSGVVIASYACTEKLMSKLLPRPTTSLTFDGGTVFEEETEELDFGDDLSAKEYVEDAKSWSETSKELLEERYAQGLQEFLETGNQEPVEEAARNAGEIGYEEDFGENLNASEDGYGIRRTQTERNDEELMNDVDAKVKEEGYEEDVDEDLDAPEDGYGNGHAHTEYIDEEPVNYVGAKVKEDGYEEDIDEDLNASRDDCGNGHTHTEYNDKEIVNDVDAKVEEERYEEVVDEDLNASKDYYGYGPTRSDYIDEEPMNDVDVVVMEEVYEEGVGEDLNISRDDYGNGHTHTQYNDEEPMNDEDAEVKEEGYEEDVGEDFNTSRDDYGKGHTNTEYNDEEPMNDVDAKVKEEGYEEDVGEYLEGQDREPLEHFDVETEEVGEEEKQTTTPAIEQSKYSQPGDHVHQVVVERYEENGTTNIEENILAGEIMVLIENLEQEGDVSTHTQEVDWEKKEKREITDKRGVESITSSEEKGKSMNDEESMTVGNEEVVTNDTDAIVKEEECKEKVDEYLGEDETSLQGFHVEIEVMGPIENLKQESDVSTPLEEVDWEKEEKCEIIDEMSVENIARSEEKGKSMHDEEEPMTASNEEVETNDTDAIVKEEEYKEKVDEYFGENEKPLQDFDVEIEEVRDEEKQETAVVIERSKWDQPLDDVHPVDTTVERNDKIESNDIEEENLARETTEVIQELRQEGNGSPPVKADRDSEGKYEVSKETDEKDYANSEETVGQDEDSCVEPVKLVPVNRSTESELIHEEQKENEETQMAVEDGSDDVMTEAERVVAMGRILHVVKDENDISTGLMVSEKPMTDENGSCNGEGLQKAEEVTEKEIPVANKKAAKRKRRNKNRTSGAAQKGFQSEGKKDVVSSDADSREISDESGLGSFDHIEKAGEKYPYSANENPEVDEKTSHGAPESREFLEISVPEVVPESIKTGTSSESQSAVSASKALLSEEKIWENIEALRTIVGYNIAAQETCVDELKSLYIFTGVEPPTSFKSPSDLAEVNDKLHFLMAIVGVK